jgi:hypothetical protein
MCNSRPNHDGVSLVTAEYVSPRVRFGAAWREYGVEAELEIKPPREFRKVARVVALIVTTEY